MKGDSFMVDVNKVSQSVLKKIDEIGQMDGKKGITSQAECDKLKDYLASGNVNGANDKEYTQSLISDYYEKAGQGSPLNANELRANAKITAKKQTNNVEIKMNAQNANKEALDSVMRAGAIVTETAGGEITITIDSTSENFADVASKLGVSEAVTAEMNVNELATNAKKKQSNNVEIKMNAQNVNKEALDSVMRAGAIVTETAGGEITITIDSTSENFADVASKLGLSEAVIAETKARAAIAASGMDVLKLSDLSVDPEVFNSLAGQGSPLNANELRGLE
jgi:hypothetical protein